MQTKILFILTIVFLQFEGRLFAKGNGGSYKIQIYLIDAKNNKPLNNVKVVINDDTLMSDSMGIVSYEQHWETVCGFKKNKLEKSKLNKSINLKFINLKYLGSVKNIKNKWRRYGLRANNRRITCIYKVKIRF